MSDDETGNAFTTRDAYEHAWNWFKYHAEQRLAMIRFAVLILGAIAAGAAYLHKDKEYLFSSIICIFEIVITYCFLRLDLRTSDLIKLGENALIEKEDQMATDTGSQAITIFRRTDELRESRHAKWYNPYTYKQNFRLMFAGAIVLYLLAASYDVILYLKK